eukprot:gene10108-13584_t
MSNSTQLSSAIPQRNKRGTSTAAADSNKNNSNNQNKITTKLTSILTNLPKNLSSRSGDSFHVNGSRDGTMNEELNVQRLYRVSQSQQQSFEECDILFQECNSFISLSANTIELAKQPNLSKTFNKLFGGQNIITKSSSASPTNAAISHPNKTYKSNSSDEFSIEHQSQDRTNSGSSNAMMNNLKMSTLNLASSINKWRAKRKGNKLFSLFDSIVTKLDETELHLKHITEDSLHSSTALVLQSLHVKSRLISCIDFNKNEIKKYKPILEETSTILDQIKKYERSLESMLIFFDEVEKQSKAQTEVGEHYVPWALRHQSELAHIGDNQSKQTKPLTRVTLQNRMLKVQEVRKLIQDSWDDYNKRQEVCKNNLSHCSRSLRTLIKVVGRINRSIIHEMSEEIRKYDNDKLLKSNPSSFADLTQSEENVAIETDIKSSNQFDNDIRNNSYDNKDTNEVRLDAGQIHLNNSKQLLTVTKEDEELTVHLVEQNFPIVEPYNHSQCSDCSCVYAIANECMSHLAAAQHTAVESTRRHQLLLQLREKIKEDGHTLEALDWGGQHQLLEKQSMI